MELGGRKTLSNQLRYVTYLCDLLTGDLNELPDSGWFPEPSAPFWRRNSWIKENKLTPCEFKINHVYQINWEAVNV